MSGSSALISSLDFTKSVGHRQGGDATFNDVSSVGGFPYEQKITRISRIEVFSDKKSAGEDKAVIVGLKVTYKISDGTSKVVNHGLVNETSLGSFTIESNEILVGAHGRIKSLSSDSKRDKRIASIGFVVFNKDTGDVDTKGPYPDQPQNIAGAWATFGPIIAFQGTRTDDLGITSLGFTKLIQGVPEFGITKSN